jgi:methyl-accepting chemotaxis protein
MKSGTGTAGVVVVGFALNKAAILDELKVTIKTDATLFLHDVRINTTIMKDGQRMVGTQLDPVIAARVLERNEKFQGDTAILGLPYVTSYMPLPGTDGRPIGVVFAGKSVAEITKTTKGIVWLVTWIAIIGLGLIIVLVYQFISRSIFKPIGQVMKIADALSQGKINMSIEATSNDEVGKLLKSFHRMVENIRSWTVATDKIASGDLSVEITAQSDEDIMGLKLMEMVNTMKRLRQEMEQLLTAASNGQLSFRGDTSTFVGVWAEMIEGVNRTLDAAIKPIKEATMVLQEMAKGNLQVQVNGEYQGDHGFIKMALNQTIFTLRKYVQEIATVLTEMANGNLDVDIVNDYQGDFVPIQDSLKLIIESFNVVLSELSNAAEQVDVGAAQIATASQNLSQISTQQASSVQEISAAMTQIATQTKENAINANHACDLSVNANKQADQGNERMQEMLRAMNDINESSTNIAKIIKVIDEIAFQTNILALNAAVEAARAGQYGKGFAVVADEVRNLAARSAKAAKETTVMIENSIQKVSQGTKYAQETAESLNQIVTGITSATQLVEEIARASNEQATAIAESSQGVHQVSQVTQSTTATSEESAAAGQELAGQSQMLRMMVNRFKLKNQEEKEPRHIPGVKQNNDSSIASEKKKRRQVVLEDKEFGKY